MRRTGAVRGLDTLRGSGELASRRRYLRSVVALGSASLAGCLDAGIGSVGDGDGGNDGQPEFQQVENPPDAVYVPSHREGVEMLGTTTDGPYRFRAMVSYAHPFWIVTGSTIEAVEVTDAVDVHLMIAVEDAESGTTLPVDSGLTTTVRDADGRLVDTRSPWRMLSQTMGVHFGDNVPLDGDGTYEVSVAVPPMDTLTTGAFDGRFDAPATTSFSFTYDQALRDRLIERIQYVDDDQRGVPGAIEPMGAATGLPPAGALPGTLQGTSGGDGEGGSASDAARLPRSHDADVAVTVVDGFAEADGPYLLVSPRTPYNRFPLAGAALTATIRSGDDAPEDVPLQAAIDDRAGFHYGAAIPLLSPGDDCTIGFDAPPSMARHAGYETAFLSMEPIKLTLEGW